MPNEQTDYLLESRAKLNASPYYSQDVTFHFSNPYTEAVDTFKGSLELQQSLSDTLFNGYQYIAEMGETKYIYNTKFTIRLNEEEKKAQLTNLKEVERPEYEVNGLIVLLNSMPSYFALLDKVDAGIYERIPQEDTLINNQKYYRTLIREWGIGMEQDTFFVNHLIQIDKKTGLPHSILRSTKEQYIHTYFDNFQLGEAKDPAAFSMKAIPEGYTVERFDPNTDPDNLIVLEKGSPAPDFEMTALDGKTYRSTDYRGKLLLLDFSIINCGYCQPAIKVVHEIMDQYPEQNLQALYLNPFDDSEQLEQYLKKVSVKMPILLDQENIARFYGVSGFPHLFLLDEEGKILLNQIGYSEELKATLMETIGQHLGI